MMSLSFSKTIFLNSSFSLPIPARTKRSFWANTTHSAWTGRKNWNTFCCSSCLTRCSKTSWIGPTVNETTPTVSCPRCAKTRSTSCPSTPRWSTTRWCSSISWSRFCPFVRATNATRLWLIQEPRTGFPPAWWRGEDHATANDLKVNVFIENIDKM